MLHIQGHMPFRYLAGYDVGRTHRQSPTQIAMAKVQPYPLDAAGPHHRQPICQCGASPFPNLSALIELRSTWKPVLQGFIKNFQARSVLVIRVSIQFITAADPNALP